MRKAEYSHGHFGGRHDLQVVDNDHVKIVDLVVASLRDEKKIGQSPQVFSEAKFAFHP